MSDFVFVLAYDISSAKSRRKLVKELEGIARRIQYSVFETCATEAQLEKVVEKTRKYISQKDGDSLLIYRLCAVCAQKRRIIGREVIDWRQAVIIE